MYDQEKWKNIIEKDGFQATVICFAGYQDDFLTQELCDYIYNHLLTKKEITALAFYINHKNTHGATILRIWASLNKILKNLFEINTLIEKAVIKAVM